MSHLRISVWPEQTVAPVPVRRLTPVLQEDDSISWWPWSWTPHGPSADDYKQLPDELVLRDLLDLDIESRSAVVEFLKEQGPICRRFTLFTSEFGNIELRRRHSGDEWKLIDQPPMAARQRPEGYWNYFIDVVLYLETMRAAVRHWLSHIQEGDINEAWRKELPGFFANDGTYTERCWRCFAEAMSAGLDVYRVRVQYTTPFADERSWTEHAPRPDLYSAMCLQLFNVMTENLPVRHCANETCGRSFFRHQGRAEYGQNRIEGVLYCSRNCARAQANREYRRRKRQKVER